MIEADKTEKRTNLEITVRSLIRSLRHKGDEVEWHKTFKSWKAAYRCVRGTGFDVSDCKIWSPGQVSGYEDAPKNRREGWWIVDLPSDLHYGG